MIRSAALMLLLIAPVALTADEPARRPTGKWTRDAGDFKVTLTFDKEQLTISLARDSGASLELVTDYGVTKESVAFGIVTEVKRDGIEAGNKGDLFRFKVKPGKDKLTVSDLYGAEHDQAKVLLEGDYKPAK